MAMFTGEEIRRSVMEDEVDAHPLRGFLNTDERERVIVAALAAWDETRSHEEALWIGLDEVIGRV